MWEKLKFYFRHSLNDLRVNGQRTVFALLCVAAGVAAIVSLQTLAVMIENSLTGNLQENNRGDIQFQPPADFGMGETESDIAEGVDSGFLLADSRTFFGQQITEYRTSAEGLDQLQAWIDETYPGQVTFTYRQPLTDMLGQFIGGGTGTALTNPETNEQATQLTPVLIDRSVYPFYSEITTLDGRPLAEALRQPTDIVLDESAAQTVGVAVGNVVRLNGADVDFTVQGIVPSEVEVKNPTTDALAALFGFYYLDHSALAYFPSVAVGADRVYLQIDAGLDVDAVERSLVVAFPYIVTTTTEDLRQDYTDLSANIDQLVSVMGLVSLLIGSIGIINTMQVIVRRRTVEVAVLKTLGLQASQVTVLFMVEALIMGVVGSLAGILLGWGATFAIRGVAESLLATDLPFVLAPLPVINGLAVGTLVTAVFGFLPTLSAGQVRPAIVLRPSDNIIPQAGCLQMFLALLVIIVVTSLVAYTILDNLVVAFQVTIGAFVAAGVLYALAWVLIWLVGRFLPSFGVIDLKISLRQMLAGRGRAAVTLLALVVGVFSLSLITLMAESISGLLSFALDEGAGGNVIVTLASQAQLGQVEAALEAAEGVNSYRVQESYTMGLQSMQEADGTEVSLDELGERLRSLNRQGLGPPAGLGGGEFELDWSEVLIPELGSIAVLTPEQVSANERTVIAGRDLIAADVGEPYLVVTSSRRIEAAGITVGDKLTFSFGGSGSLLSLGGGVTDDPETITLEVVGIVARPAISASFGGAEADVYVLDGAFPPEQRPNNIIVVADVAEESLPDVRRELGRLPGVFALETAILNRLLSSLLATFTAFPSMVAALGLVVGGVVIANSVALTTMERRREIAVMKAIGLQRERVLAMLLLENAILGLIGGLIGVGIGLLALVLLVASVGAPGSALPVGTAFLLMMLCVIVALAAAITTAWGASAEKPLNVLRYE